MRKNIREALRGKGVGGTNYWQIHRSKLTALKALLSLPLSASEAVIMIHTVTDVADGQLNTREHQTENTGEGWLSSPCQASWRWNVRQLPSRTEDKPVQVVSRITRRMKGSPSSHCFCRKRRKNSNRCRRQREKVIWYPSTQLHGGRLYIFISDGNALHSKRLCESLELFMKRAYVH